MPNLIELHSPVDTTGLTYVRIRKKKPGDGLRAGKRLASIIPIFKVVVVVDEDIDVLNSQQVNTAIGSRYRPKEDTLIIDSVRGMPLDPSVVSENNHTSKVVIDATIPWPEEGGPENFARLNRSLLEELAPESFDLVNEKWGNAIKRKYTDFGAL